MNLKKLFFKEEFFGFILFSPVLLLIIFFLLYPLVYGLWMSFHKVQFTRGLPMDWIGADHYFELLRDKDFWTSLYITLVYAGTTAFLSTFLGLFVALLVREKFPMKRIVRGAILIPYIAPLISLVFVWKYIFDPVFGFANYVLVDILNILKEPVDWMESPQFSIYAVILFDIWRYFPFAFLLIYARTMAIPEVFYESAKIDGAGILNRFRYITFPQLKGILGIVFGLRFLWNFHKFDDVYLISHEVKTLSVYIYEKAFTVHKLGLGAALSWILFGFLTILFLIYGRKLL